MQKVWIQHPLFFFLNSMIFPHGTNTFYLYVCSILDLNTFIHLFTPREPHSLIYIIFFHNTHNNSYDLKPLYWITLLLNLLLKLLLYYDTYNFIICNFFYLFLYHFYTYSHKSFIYSAGASLPNIYYFLSHYS